jgi:hypothetical protein
MHAPRARLYISNNAFRLVAKPGALSGRSGVAIFARGTGAKRSQEIISIDTCAVAIVPAKLNRIVAHRPDLLEFRPGHGNKSSL